MLTLHCMFLFLPLQPQQPKLCSKGCGFFASSAGLCSKCYRDNQHTQEQQQQLNHAQHSVAPPAVSSPAPPTQPAATSHGVASETAAAGALDSISSSAPGKSGPTRCAHAECKKKIGLTGFKCKCDLLFCGAHRHAEAHDCPFDYKSQERKKLAAQNPLVAAAKVQKI